MKINNYIKFLKEAASDDDYAELNRAFDDLEGSNKKEDDEWEHGDDEWEYEDDEWEYEDDKWEYEDDNYDSSDDEGLDDLFDLFHKLFNNSNIYDVDIDGTTKQINMFFHLNYREKLRDIASIFTILSKIKSDILPQFEDLVEVKSDKFGVILEVTLKYRGGYDESTVPF